MSDISSIYVPDEGPIDAKILFVGEAPGTVEEAGGIPGITNILRPQPFHPDAEAGKLLTSVLGRNGLQRSDVRLTNLCHYRPRDNKFGYLLNSPQLQAGVKELVSYLQTHKPRVICALGNWPMYFLTGKQGKKAGSGILNWRGSILTCILPTGEGELKVIPTIHPAFVTRSRSFYPIFDIDIKRVIEDSEFSELRLPKREYVICKSAMEYEEHLQVLLQHDEISVDIETFGDYLACVGFSVSPARAYCFVNDNSISFDSAITRILNSSARKIFHFGTFDTSYLKRKGFLVNNYAWDTYVAQHVMWPELPKSLKFLSSIYTREPYYKDEGKESQEDKKSWNVKSIDRDRLWIYNCKDAAVTFEIYKQQRVEIDSDKDYERFFKYEMELLGVASAISDVGLLRDERRKNLLEYAIASKYADHQSSLERLVGGTINVNSNPQIHSLLYDVLKLPPRRNRKGKITADDHALMALIAQCKEKMESLKRPELVRQWQQNYLILKMITLIRGERKLLSSYIYAKVSDDGRIHSTFKIGPETGRWSAEKWVDGNGLNAQTLPRDPVDIPDDLTEDKAASLISSEILFGEDDSESASDSDSEGDELSE